MTPDIIIVLSVLVVAVILFITEAVSVDLVALSAMAILLLTGILSPEDGLAGFSNEATITIAAMFIISAGLFSTGLVNYVGRKVVKLYHKNFITAITATMLIVAVISAFINNTPVVAIFIPILLQVSRDTKINASKLLMPLSFASIFGGICTLIGTSTNIVVSSIAVKYGEPAIGMFEFTKMGILFLIAGVLYMLFAGIPLIPKRRTEADLTNSFGLGEYLTEIILLKESRSVGKELKEAPLITDLNLDVIEIQRGEKRIFIPSPVEILRENDLLRVKCNVEKIKELQEKRGITLKPGSKWKDEDIVAGDIILVEAIISPNSRLIDKSLKQVSFRYRYSATALAIRHRGKFMHENIAGTKLLAGDALLIEVRKMNLDRLRETGDFVVVSEVASPTFRKTKIMWAIAIITAVVLSATLGFLPISISAMVGGILLIFTGCLTLEQAYKSIDWKIIVLLAGSLSLGLALEKTGAANLISGYVINLVGDLGPIAVLSALYLLTLMLTEAMSNNATAALLTPIAIVTANSLGVDPRPFLVAIAFAASLAFMSPLGYQTHLLIYNPGRYKYYDFLRVGTPLNFIYWIMGTLLIPVFFPL
jgi:di/tricarboxylate transporter